MSQKNQMPRQKKTSGRKNLMLILTLLLVLSAIFYSQNRPQEAAPSSGDFEVTKYSGDPLRIVAGSENKELEPILQEYADQHKINLRVDYLGSLDIMRQLQSGQVDYDAVWPASSIWLSLGDDHHLLKHAQTTSTTPIVFGIRQSLAEELGFVGRDVYIQDIMEAIKAGRLNFAMTSATQSNSGASAYLGFLTAIAKSQGGLTMEDLQDPKTGDQIQQLLAGVNRSSGSSNWLVDLFMEADYDAMVNYEALIIQANKKISQTKDREPLHVVYPVDGLAISDSPLAYVDHGDRQKEEAFLDLQTYLLSDQAQNKIEQTGKRSRLGTVEQANRALFNPEWGIDLDRVISPIRWPNADVIKEALVLYQTQFKKPALTVYVLDFSGSMSGEGYRQMMQAMEEVLLPDKAKANLLQGTQKDISVVIPFAGNVYPVLATQGNGQELVDLNNQVQALRLGGGTAMYEGIDEAIDQLTNPDGPYFKDLNHYTPAVVVLTDGQPNGAMKFKELADHYHQAGQDIPIFSILFGEAEEAKMKELAELSRARVFDGRKDLVNAFRQVKGYN